MFNVALSAALDHIFEFSGELLLIKTKNIVDCFVVTIESGKRDFRVFCQSAGVQAGEVGFVAVNSEERREDSLFSFLVAVMLLHLSI